MSFPQPSDFRPPIIPDGEVYDNPENGRSYYWTQILLPEGSTPDTATSIGGYWTVVCDSADGKYVLKAGDTMTGALEFDDTEEAIKFKPEAGQRQTVEVLRDNNSGTVGGGLDVFLLGNSDYNQLRILGRSSADGDKEFFKVGGNEGTSIFSGRVNLNKPVEDSEDSEGFVIKGTIANGPEDPTSGGRGNLLNVYHNANAADAINYAGKINSPSNLVNKGYVDDKDDLLRQDIIELEEEINAIAPSLEYGNWEWKQPANNTRPPEQGTFYLLDDALELTTSYDNASSIVISNYEYDDPNDDDPVDIHTWADADPDELIQLFDAADPDFLLGKIVQVHNDGPEYVRIEITRIQSSGVPNDNADPVTGLFLTRVNVFKEPSGGTASDFVLKSGDTMEGPGPLVIKTAKSSYNSASPGTGTAYIKFQNKYGSGTAVHDVNVFMGGGNNTPNGLCITGRPLHVSSTIYSSGLYKARSSTAEYNPDLYIQSTEGQLRYNNTKKLSWQSDGIIDIIIKNNDGDKGMIIKRDRSSTNRVQWSGVVDISTSGSERCIGELWYNKNDGVMYLRIS